MFGGPFLITNVETDDAYVTEDLNVALAADIAFAKQCGVDPDALNAILWDWDSARNLIGVRIQDDPHPWEMKDSEWNAWFAYHLDQDRYWSDGRIFIKIDHRFTGEITPTEWPKGMPIQVAGIHADREKSWRHITSWEELRQATEMAEIDEKDALEEIARQRDEEEATWEPLRQAHRDVLEAEKVLRRAEQERANLMRQYVRAGETRYKLAKVLGMTQPRVARIIGEDR